MMKKIFKISYLNVIYLFLYLPILILIANSFNENRFGVKWSGFTLKWYEQLLQNDSLIQAATHSLTVAIISATCVTLLGTLTAIALYRYDFSLKKLINALLFIIMMSPDIVMAISFLALFSALHFKLGFITLLIAHITFCLPFVVLTVFSRLKGFDLKIIEAAKDLGASEITILGKIIIPISKPAIFSAWLLSFTLSLDDVIISSFVTGPTYEILPLKVYSMVKVGITPEINALATLMLGLSLIMIALSQFIGRSSLKETLS